MRVAEPLVAVTALQADAVGLQRVEGVFDLFQGRVDVEHRQRREQAEAARMVAHHAGRVLVAGAGQPAGLRPTSNHTPGVEPIDSTPVRTPFRSISSIILSRVHATTAGEVRLLVRIFGTRSQTFSTLVDKNAGEYRSSAGFGFAHVP